MRSWRTDQRDPLRSPRGGRVLTSSAQALQKLRCRRDAGHEQAVVPTGLALCKLHHAAFDSYIIGVTPDLEVKARLDVLEEIDEPMLVHGLQGFQGRRIHVARPEFLTERYDLFRPSRLKRAVPMGRRRLCYAPAAAARWNRRRGEEARMTLPKTMQATVLVAPHRFELQERPVPEPGPEDVLVRVRACGV